MVTVLLWGIEQEGWHGHVHNSQIGRFAPLHKDRYACRPIAVQREVSELPKCNPAYRLTAEGYIRGGTHVGGHCKRQRPEYRWISGPTVSDSASLICWAISSLGQFTTVAHSWALTHPTTRQTVRPPRWTGSMVIRR